ncbi:MAG: PEP-CTERM sorting domain-containing protein [Armatimonadota bacterium]
MRFLTALLATACAVLAAGSGVAGVVSWAGYDWETQPWPGYSAGSTYVDADTGFLFQNPVGAPKTAIPFPGMPLAGERFSVAKLVSPPSGIIQLSGRVFENSYRTQGPSLYIKSDLGKILSVGVRPSFDGTRFAYYMLNYWNGSAWTNLNLIERGRNTYNNYLRVTYTLNGTGGIDVLANYTSAPAHGGNGDYAWSTPDAFGSISEVLLLQAVQDNYTGGLCKWTDFWIEAVAPIPEPASLTLAGLGLAAVARLRRR